MCKISSWWSHGMTGLFLLRTQVIQIAQKKLWSRTLSGRTPRDACVRKVYSSAAASGSIALPSMSTKKRTAEIAGVRYRDQRPMTAPPISVIITFLSLLRCGIQRSTPVVGVHGPPEEPFGPAQHRNCEPDTARRTHRLHLSHYLVYEVTLCKETQAG